MWQRDDPGNGKNGIVLSVVNKEGLIKAARIKILPTAPNIAQGTGNADALITQADTVFLRLRLWQDANHNGIAESFELHTLSAFGIDTLELDYKESRRTDEYGNQ
ncbi:MAG TPA: hypothetical protein VFD48_08010, partial [Pyrinomonadaceae bacterium]|nr:hypothetical protein [Pyrinomonadaceae bacterium]